jgi:uroporphyrinogen-III decarboxylase
MGIPYDVTFHPKWWHKNAGVSFNKDFFYNAGYRIAADIRMRKVLNDKFGDFGLGENHPSPRPILGSDLIASGFLHSELFGCEVRYSDENPPEVLCRNMKEEDVLKLQVPNLDTSELWQMVQKQIDELLAEYGTVYSCINLMGIQNIALDLRGSELYIDYYTNPKVAHHLLSLCTDLSIQVGKRLEKVSRIVSTGVTSIVAKTIPDVYLTSNCSVDLISLRNYRDFLLPYDNRLAECFPIFGIHHCGKTMEHVVDGYRQVKNLKFAEVGAFSNIEQVRRKLPEVFLNVRYSPVKLKEASVEEMREDIATMVQAGTPPHLLSISCVGIDDTVPDEQIRNFLMLCSAIDKT